MAELVIVGVDRVTGQQKPYSTGDTVYNVLGQTGLQGPAGVGLIGETGLQGPAGNSYILQGACANQATTTDSQTVYWGGLQLAQQTTGGNCRIYIPKSGNIKRVYVYAHAGTAGTGEAWSMYIRLNNTSDTLIETVTLASANRLWSNINLNIPVVQGNYIEIKEVQPAWATNPANVRRNFVVYIE